MTPTLVGRWQTRLLLLSTVGLAVTAGYGAWFARGESSGDPLMPLRLLGCVGLLGLLWDVLYHWLQGFRWDGDWPWAFHVVAGVTEGVTVFLLLQADLLPGAEYRSGDGLRVTAHYGSVWILTSWCQIGPLRALWPRWRFTGGRILPPSRSATTTRPGHVRARIGLIAAVAAVAAVLAAGCGPPATASAPASESSSSLAELLDEGGFVVAVAAAEAAGPSTEPGACSSSLLTVEGRERVRQIGTGLALLRPPFARIVTGDNCGAEAMAEYLQAVLVEVPPPVRLQAETTAVTPSETPVPGETEGEQLALRTALSSAPPPGTNIVVVTGSTALRAATGLELAEGDATIFRPAHPGALLLVDHVRADAWSVLDERTAPRAATELPS